MGNWGLTTIVNMLYGASYTDLCYGLNAFWKDVLPYMDVDCSGFEVETLINIRIAKAGLSVLEVPSFEGNRIHGVSNLNAWRDGLRVLKTILREWRPIKRDPAQVRSANAFALAAGRVMIGATAAGATMTLDPTALRGEVRGSGTVPVVESWPALDSLQ